jgi:hypothetical protein
MGIWWLRLTRRLAILRQVRNPADAVLLLRILAFATVVPLLLRLKLSRLQPLLEPKTPRLTPEPARVQRIVSLVDAALQIGKPLVRSGCLTRGVTLYYFLSRSGLEVTLCFGMGTLGEKFVGHCWLSRGGEPFLEATDPRPRFTEVYRFSKQRVPVRPGGQRSPGRPGNDAKP